MKEPKRIPLTDSPRSKDVKKIPLKTNIIYDIESTNDKNYEDYSEHNSQSVQQLDSEPTD